MLDNLVQIGSKPTEYYNGIMMRANPRLHEEAFAKLSSLIEQDAKIIDMGAGQGAFSKRLSDNGFDVLAVDTNPEDFMAKGLAYRHINFDKPDEIEALKAELKDHFDAAVGMEVIEHVENPWEYIRLLASLVRPGGIVFLTTPNVESGMSKIQFLLSGKYAHFSYDDFKTSGHINPLTMLELEIIAESQKLPVIEAGTMCRIPKLTVSRNIKYSFYSVINLAVGWAMGPRANGDINYIVLRKTENNL